MNECPNRLDNSIIPKFRNFRDKMFLRVKNMIQFKWISNQLPLTQFMRFSRQVHWGALPFPPLVGHILSELSTMTCLSWVPPHGMAYSFTELRKPLCRDKAVLHEGERVSDGVQACRSPRGHTELDTTGQLNNNHQFSFYLPFLLFCS